MRVMRGCFGPLVLIMLGGHAVMMRRFLVMFGGGMMMGAGRMFVRHEKAPRGSSSSSPQSREINMSGRVIFRELRARQSAVIKPSHAPPLILAGRGEQEMA